MPVRYDPDTTKSFSERRGKPKSGGAATARSSVPRSIAMKYPVVLITGALTGIGRAAALAFAAEGSRIVVSGRREEAGQALAAELRGLGAEAEFVRADVRHEDDVLALVDRTVELFGKQARRRRAHEIRRAGGGRVGRPGSTRSHRARPKPRCSTASPAAPNARPALWRVFRSNVSASLTRSPTRSSSSLRADPPSP